MSNKARKFIVIFLALLAGYSADGVVSDIAKLAVTAQSLNAEVPDGG